jgi:hypothetical protein
MQHRTISGRIPLRVSSDPLIFRRKLTFRPNPAKNMPREINASGFDESLVHFPSRFLLNMNGGQKG